MNADPTATCVNYVVHVYDEDGELHFIVGGWGPIEYPDGRLSDGEAEALAWARLFEERAPGYTAKVGQVSYPDFDGPIGECLCECGGKGYFWPMATDGDDSHDWVERCDECRRFPSDDDAAVEVAMKTGLPLVFAVPGGLSRPHPFIDGGESWREAQR